MLIGIVSLLICFGVADVNAQSGKNYYEGKTLKILVSSSPGGGTDTTARLVARFLPKFIPGNPQTIVQNMPGGGGTISNNYFAANNNPDGTLLFQDSSSGLGNFVRGGSRIKYDPRKYQSIGSLSRGGSILIMRKDAKARLNDPKAKKVVIGDSDGIRTWLAVGVWGAEYLGWNMRFVFGYPGTRELSLALRQGEIDVWATSNAKIINDMMKEGGYELLVQQDDERRPGFPNVPTFEEALGGKKPKGVSWEAYQAWTGANDIDKFLIAPEATPENLTKILRDGYEKMIKDEAFMTEARKFFGDATRGRPGATTQTMIREATTISKDADDFLNKLRRKYGLPTSEQRK